MVATAVAGLAAACFIESDSIWGVAWMDDGWVYAKVWRMDTNPRLVRLKPGAGPEPVEFAPPGCRAPSVEAVSRASPAVLVVAASCPDGTGLYTYNVVTQEIERFGLVKHWVDDMTWSPDLRVGYVAAEHGFCEGVARVEDGELVLADRRISLDGATWRPDELYHFDQYYVDDKACVDTGVARGPSLAGSDLYLAASGQASGVRGTYDRWVAPTAILRIVDEAGEGRVEVVKDGLRKVSDLAVSPDRRLLAVTAEWDGRRSCWILNLADGSMTDLDVDDATSIAFSPAGNEVAVVEGHQKVVFRSVAR